MSTKIETAAQVTREISATVERVRSLIGKDAPINRLGVYIFPDDQERVLRLAAAELSAAAGRIARTPWPNKADYEKIGYTL